MGVGNRATATSFRTPMFSHQRNWQILQADWGKQNQREANNLKDQRKGETILIKQHHKISNQNFINHGGMRSVIPCPSNRETKHFYLFPFLPREWGAAYLGDHSRARDAKSGSSLPAVKWLCVCCEQTQRRQPIQEARELIRCKHHPKVGKEKELH